MQQHPTRGAPIDPAILTPYKVIDVADGLGVIELVEEGERAFRLRLAEDDVAADADAHEGSLEWIATRLLHPRGLTGHHRLNAWTEPPEWDRLRRWLRHVEPGDDPAGPLAPLLGLLAPGPYAVGVETLPKPFIAGTRQNRPSRWYAGMEGKGEASAIIPTHHWAPRRSTVDEHRRLIEYERRRPASIVLTHPDSEVYYLLDGHHKLAAYMAAGRDPVAVVIELGTGPRPDYLAYLDQPSDEYRIEENESGSGALTVTGCDGTSSLRIGKRPFMVEGYTCRGSLDRLAVSTGDARLRRQLPRLREQLRLADPGAAAALTRAVWGLLAPGRYGLRRWVPDRYHLMPTGEHRHWTWYLGISTPEFGTALLATDRWPSPHTAAVRDYRERIAAGERPLVLTLRAAPPPPVEDDAEDAVAFVIDGHHKLRAYELAGIAPHCLDIARIGAEPTCPPGDLRAVVADTPELQEATSHLQRYLDDPR
ncbi:hypothetical protein [Glycomyces sp. MUSA5-2]|uniref:hypothetical protein n=1 Tax=Glycomyces sp. MUSA5-2 TaxID=2053002 RepID=UPI0030091FC6